jgi:hypothetical protein
MLGTAQHAQHRSACSACLARSAPRSARSESGRPAATRRHAYFYPNWSTLTSIFSASSYRIFLIFDSKKKLVFFSLIFIICLREIWLERGVVVQQSLPLPCRGDFPVSWGEHVSRGGGHLRCGCGPAKWPNRGKPWALDWALAVPILLTWSVGSVLGVATSVSSQGKADRRSTTPPATATAAHLSLRGHLRRSPAGPFRLLLSPRLYQTPTRKPSPHQQPATINKKKKQNTPTHT